MRDTCPHCNRVLVAPNGREYADILLVGDYPWANDVKVGLPFTDRNGKVLRYELGRVGLPIETCRSTNLWPHYKPEDKKVEAHQSCLDYGFSQLVREIQIPRRGVLFMGSDLTDLFGVDMSDVLGVPFKPTDFTTLITSVNSSIVMFTYSPTYVFHAGIGEFRLSLEKFRKATKNFKREPLIQEG
ncbi:MAG: hypothetical protein DDT31_01495 [Syntrophomonadaceae bacterium]|nr:hypothetical protein [Bacillota bacterium]